LLEFLILFKMNTNNGKKKPFKLFHSVADTVVIMPLKMYAIPARRCCVSDQQQKKWN